MRIETKMVLTLAGIALLAMPDVSAQRPMSEQRQARSQARQFRTLQVAGDQVHENVHKLTKGLRWHKSLAGALGSAKNSGKPVVWIQALGDLDGFL